jgi:hypothetical protein
MANSSSKLMEEVRVAGKGVNPESRQPIVWFVFASSFHLAPVSITIHTVMRAVVSRDPPMQAPSAPLHSSAAKEFPPLVRIPLPFHLKEHRDKNLCCFFCDFCDYLRQFFFLTG